MNICKFFNKKRVKNSATKSVCVFCSGDDKVPQEYKNLAYNLGRDLAVNGFILVTGGGNNGLMNYVNNGHADVLDSSKRYGVIPKIMRNLNVHHLKIAEKNLIWSDDVHSRIQKFYELSDNIVVLPGGFGTTHELMDCLVLNQFGVIKKHIYLLNIDGFWDALIAQFKHMVSNNVLQQKHLDHLNVVTSLSELMLHLTSEREFNLSQGFADGHWKENPQN